MKRLVLPKPIQGQLVTDALQAAQLEICGLLAGDGEHCRAAYPVKNVSPDPDRAFYMDPQSQINAMQAMRESGESLVGIYHSHPRSAAVPSPSDVAGAAYPGVAYVIISLFDRAQPEMAAYDFRGGRFEQIDIVTEA